GQRNISARNFDRIEALTHNPDPGVRRLAAIVLEIARVKTHKRGRMQIIARDHPELFVKMVTGLADGFWHDYFDRHGIVPGDWLWERHADVERQLRFQDHGSAPCWCGSGA